MRRALLSCCLLACLPLAGCKRSTVTHGTLPPPGSPLNPGTFITSPGIWQHRVGVSNRELEVTRSGNDVEWHYTITQNAPAKPGTSRTEDASTLHLPSAGSPWFIYVETAGCLWFFDGKDQLVRRQESDTSAEAKEIISSGQIEPDAGEIPPEVISRLPADLQKLAPKPASSSPPRPSI